LMPRWFVSVLQVTRRRRTKRVSETGDGSADPRNQIRRENRDQTPLTAIPPPVGLRIRAKAVDLLAKFADRMVSFTD